MFWCSWKAFIRQFILGAQVHAGRLSSVSDSVQRNGFCVARRSCRLDKTTFIVKARTRGRNIKCVFHRYREHRNSNIFSVLKLFSNENFCDAWRLLVLAAPAWSIVVIQETHQYKTFSKLFQNAKSFIWTFEGGTRMWSIQHYSVPCARLDRE